ncbi:cupin-like domain-containing protein [Aureococcus anophagefferens]|nr:cupin-like domain-containing protein [Aureococcus anophagefferens]
MVSICRASMSGVEEYERGVSLRKRKRPKEAREAFFRASQLEYPGALAQCLEAFKDTDDLYLFHAQIGQVYLDHDLKSESCTHVLRSLELARFKQATDEYKRTMQATLDMAERVCPQHLGTKTAARVARKAGYEFRSSQTPQYRTWAAVWRDAYDAAVSTLSPARILYYFFADHRVEFPTAVAPVAPRRAVPDLPSLGGRGPKRWSPGELAKARAVHEDRIADPAFAKAMEKRRELDYWGRDDPPLASSPRHPGNADIVGRAEAACAASKEGATGAGRRRSASSSAAATLGAVSCACTVDEFNAVVLWALEHHGDPRAALDVEDVKRATYRLYAHRPPPGDCERIDVSDLSLDEFLARYAFPSRPVVISGAAKGWRALDTWHDLDYLTDAAGNELHRVYAVPLAKGDDTGAFEAIRRLSERELLYGMNVSADRPGASEPGSEDVMVRPAENLITLDAYVALAEKLRASKKKKMSLYFQKHAIPRWRAARSPDTGAPLVPGDVTPSLRDRGFAEFLLPFKELLWFAMEPARADLHFDPYENLHVVVEGAKTFTMFPPSNNDELYFASAGEPADHELALRLRALSDYVHFSSNLAAYGHILNRTQAALEGAGRAEL